MLCCKFSTPINPLMKQSQYVPVSSNFPYIFLSVLCRRDSADPGGEKRIDWPSSEQLFDHVADVFVLWVEHQIHQITTILYTRSYQYKKLGTDLHFRYHSMQQGEIRRCRSVKQEQSYRGTEGFAKHDSLAVEQSSIYSRHLQGFTN